MLGFRDAQTVAPVDGSLTPKDSCCTVHTSKSMPRKIPAHSFDFSFLNPPGFFFCFFYGLADALIDLVSPLMWLGNWHRLKRRTRRQTLRGRQCQKADRSWKSRQFQKRTGDEFRDRNGCVKWRREEMHMLPFEVQKRPTWEEELCLASTHRGNSLAWESSSLLSSVS